MGQLDDNTVTSEQISAGAVTARKLLDGAVTAAQIRADAYPGHVRLTTQREIEGILHVCPFAGINRNGRHFHLWAGAYGFTIHRHGGVSLCGIPHTGGTSILWGKSRDRVRRFGRDHRAIELGPVGIYIGSDF